MKRLKSNKGIAYIEILVVFGIVGILISFTYINLLGINPRASSQVTQDSVIADLKSQQLKAMDGDTDGGATTENFGVHFESDKYTLFVGSSYLVSNSRNFVIRLDDGISFSSINVPGGDIIFSKGSGEVIGYSSTNNSITIQNNTGQTRTIIVNQLGVITQVN